MGDCTFNLCNARFALDLDTSVDDEIRRTYDPSKLEQSLPSLPKTAPSQNTSPKNMPAPQTPPKSLPVTPDAKPQIGVKKFQNDFKYDKSTAIRIKKVRNSGLSLIPLYLTI